MAIHLYYICMILIIVYKIILVFISNIKRKLQKHPPSPFPCLPLIGHFHLLSPPFTVTLAKLSNQYGPVLALWLGSRLNVLITSPSAAEECFTKNDVVFCNRPSGSLLGRIVGYNFTTINFAPYGPHWKNLRKIAKNGLLSSQRLESMANIRNDEVMLLIQRLYNKYKSSSTSSLLYDDYYKEVGIKIALFDTTFNVMTRMMFGRRYVDDEKAKRFREVVGGMVELLNLQAIGDGISWLRWLDWKKESKCRKFIEKRDTLLLELIEEQRIELEKKDETNTVVKPMVQALLEMQQLEPEYYKDNLIIGLVSDLLIGGADTTSGTMEWMLALLLNHPEVLKKAQEEIEKQVGYDRIVNEADLNSLPYLQCIIKETLRMYPINPFLAPHESSEDCVVQGYHIPRGTFLSVNIWAIQNDPKLCDDPTTFRPERFYGVKGYKVGCKMMPFGSGRRICPGEELAVRAIGLTIGSMIQCFEWKRVEDDKLVDMNLAPMIQLQMAEPLRARVRPRLVMMKLLEKLL